MPALYRRPGIPLCVVSKTNLVEKKQFVALLPDGYSNLSVFWKESVLLFLLVYPMYL